MNIGIYVRSLAPKGPSEAHLQAAIFAGLRKLNPQQYRLFVFFQEDSSGIRKDEHFTYVELAREGWRTRIVRYLKGRASAAARFVAGVLGLTHRRSYARLARWPSYEPPYYQQLRDLNIRLIWNLTEQELTSFVPYTKIIWDINFRMNCMYPEYSYTRFGFEASNRSMETLHKASYVIVGTEEGKRQLIDIFGVYEKKIRVIPFPTPIFPTINDKSGAVTTSRAQAPYIFYPARFWPHKNHVVLVAALKALQDQWGIALKCVFSGIDEGNLGYVLQYAETKGVRNQIEYVGLASDKELTMLYRNAAALVFCSAIGPDNLPPLEAMSLGCPVITAEVPGAREQYGDAALFFDPMSEQQLAERIKEILNDQGLRETMITRGRLRAARWTAEDYAKSVVSIFDEFSLIARAWERCDSVFT
jgi:glycosyltransferase involved in cell wall biosynthesis